MHFFLIRFRTEKREKLKLLHFGAFQKKTHMPSRGKYTLHILFGAFNVENCMTLLIQGAFVLSISKLNIFPVIKVFSRAFDVSFDLLLNKIP